jgi:nicotinamide phosphoribosyltransferase
MYPKGMEYLQSNFTPRSSRIEGVNKVVFFGLQAFIKEVLEKQFDKFFGTDGIELIYTHTQRVEKLLGKKFDAQHWLELWRLGYLPLKFCALKEGMECPLRVPMFTIENTVPGYGWLVNYIESVLSNSIWMPMTSATTALRLRRMLDKYAAETSDTPEFVDWQGHDFSFRGMSSPEAGAASGAGHLLSFAGSDTLLAMDYADLYYSKNGYPVKFSGGSVPATEHSVMCAGGKDDELETFRRLLKEYPTGILSVVSDTWDLWKVITEILPQLKDEIMARDGKLVIRPDSGDPVDILCGDWDRKTGSPAQKGVVELLYEIFPGPTNSKGFKTLDSHIGTIYGDSITFDRAQQICERLKSKKFATTTPVLGVGSFSYQYVTRDTFGFAMKATWCQVNGEARNLYKDPVTDNGIKKSAKGRLAVLKDGFGELFLVNEANKNEELASELKEIWKDGKFTSKEHTFREIAERIGVRKVMPE